MIGAGTKAVSIDNLDTFCPSIGLKSTQIWMHVLPIGESTLQGKSNRLCSFQACCRVDNDSVKN